MAEEDTRRLRVTVSGDSKAAQLALQALGRKVKEAGGDLDKLKSKLDGLARKHPNVKIDVDDKAAQTKLSRFQDKLRMLRNPHVRVDADDKSAVAKITLFRQKLMALNGKTAKVNVKADTKTAEAGMQRLAAKFRDVSIEARALRTVGLIGAISGLLGPTSRLVANLAPLSGLLVALPAAALGAGAAFGVLHVALSGVKTAISAGMVGDTKAYDKALSKLTGTAQNFVKAIVKLKPQLDNLKNSLQSHLLAGLAGDMTKLASKTLPRVKAGLVNIADGFNSIAREATKAINSSAGIKTFNTVTNAVANGLKKASGAVAPMADAMSKLAVVGAPLLTRLGNDATQLAEKFDNFIVTASRSGELKKWLGDAITTLKTLWKLAGNVFGILEKIFSAAGKSGGNFLNTLTKLTGVLNTFLGTAQGAKDLKTVFSALNTIGSALGKALASFLPALGKMLQGIAPAIKPLSDALVKVVQAVTPLLPSLGKLAGLVATVLAGAIGNVLVPVLSAVAGMLGVVANFLNKHQKLTKALTIAILAWAAAQIILNIAMDANPIGAVILAVTALATVAYVVYKHWQTISNFFTGTVWPWLKGTGKYFLLLLGPIGLFGFAAIEVATHWRGVWTFFKAVARWFAGPFVHFFENIGHWFAGPFVNFFKGVGHWFAGPFLSPFKAIGRFMSGPFVNFFKAIPGKIVSGFNAVKRFFTKTVPSWIGTLVGKAKMLFNDWVNGWKLIWHKLQSAVLIPIKNFFVKTIPSWAGTLVGKMKGLWQQIADKIRGVKDFIVNRVGGAIYNFFVRSIPRWTGALVGKIKQLWQQISDKINGVKNFLVNRVGGAIYNFFVRTIPRWTGALVGKMKQLWQQISDKINGVKNFLVNRVGGAIYNFFVRTIPRWTGTLVGRIKDLWNQIKDHINSVKNFLVNKIGGSIYNFFVRSIPRWTGTLVGKIKSLWKDAADGVRSAWNKVKGYAAKPMIFVVETVFKNGLLKAWDTIAGLVPGMKKATGLEKSLGSLIGKLKGYRSGGAISGAGTGTSDSVPIMASNGEHMWTADEVKAVGGHRAMFSLRAAAKAGRLFHAPGPGYATGGPIFAGAQRLARGGIVAAGKGISPYTIPRLITEIAQKIQPSAHMTSGYRPGSYSLEGNRDYHSQGKAADLVSNNMNALAAAFYGVRSYLLEEIHTRYGSNTGWYVKNGHAVSNSFYGAEVPIHRDHVHIAMTYASAMSLLNQMKGHHGSSFLDKIRSFGGSLLNLASGNFFLDWIKDVLPKFNPVKALINKIPGKGTVMGDGLRGAAGGALKFAEDAVKKLVDDANASGGPDDIGGGKYHGGGNVGKWLHEAMKLTHVGGSWYPMLYRIAMRESRGNPNAINNYDINWKHGDPSEGMMQIIISNFKRFHLPGHGNIWNPVDNAAAAIQYIKAVYGNPANTPRNYYATGTTSARRGLAVVGEDGPELINFRGGESVTPNSALGGVHIDKIEIVVNDSSDKELAKKLAHDLRVELAKEFRKNGIKVPGFGA